MFMWTSKITIRILRSRMVDIIMDQYTISTPPMRKNPIKSAPVHADYYIHPLIPRIYYGQHYD